jgi:acyl carrier protein
MSEKPLTEQLREIIVEIAELDASKVSDDVRLRDLGVDSMQFLEIVTDIEKRFKVKIEESEYQNVRTIRDAAAFLERKCGGSP